MARKTRIALPGQSRSTTCPKARCGRLDGHKGDCRPTLMAARKAVQPIATEGGVEVLSADRYTVLSDEVAKKPEPKARIKTSRKRAPKGQCRVSRRDVRCSLRLGHKSLGRRHRFGSPVRIVPEAKPTRMVAASPKRARRSAYITSGKPSARLA